MPRKSQKEKVNETPVERPATRRSVRLSASSVASPELPKSSGKGSAAKSPATPVSPSKTTSGSPSGTKGIGTRSISSSKAASRSNAKTENEALQDIKAATVEEGSKDESTNDSGAGQKKRGRQTKGKGVAANVKDEEAEVKKEPEKDNVENTKDTKQDLEDKQTMPVSTGRQRRGRSAVSPVTEKIATPRRCDRGRGKASAEAEHSGTVSTAGQDTKRKREDDDCAQVNEEVGSSPKKPKPDNVEDVNVEKMEVDTKESEETKVVGEERVAEISEKTEEPTMLSGDLMTSESDKAKFDEKLGSGEKHSSSETAALTSPSGAATDVKENGLGQVNEVVMESYSLSVAFESGVAAATDAHATTSSDKTADVLSNGTSDVLCSRKFIWFQGNEPSQSDLLRSFSVVSYNVLADYHAQRDYTEPGIWIAKEHLAIDYRHDLLMKEIRFLDGDILCFQEVGTDYFTSMLKPALAELGYDGLYVPRYTTAYSEGEATFFRTKRFNLESSQSLVLSKVAEREIDESGIEPDVKNFVKEAVESHAVALLIRLKCLNTEATVACANIHVAYDKFERQDKQCLQLACAIRELVKFAGGPDKPHFICGDFNSWPESPPYQLVRDGHLSEKSLTALQSINAVNQSDGQLAPLVNYWSEGFQYSPSGNLRSAYVEILGKEPLTSRFHMDGVVRSVDYMWFSSNTMQVKGVMETIEEEKIKDGVPNAIFPSDHLSLKAIFSFK